MRGTRARFAGYLVATQSNEMARPHRLRVKLYGLRMLDPGIFSKLPLASADSTNVARNVGLDQRWRGTYVPQSRAVRAQILMKRIERHAAASYWSDAAVPSYQNMELFG